MKTLRSAEKARVNLREHEISFPEATTVFDDPFFLVYRSEEHSAEENRYVIIGVSERERLLAVAFTERKRIRIISAQADAKREKRL